MATAAPSVRGTKTVVARVPYLNCAPFFHGLTQKTGWGWADLPPRQLGQAAESGQVVAGPMALADFLRLKDRFERLGSLGIAVRGRCGSATLFSRKPLRQLDGSTIAVTEETSTTALLLRLVLEQRYELKPHVYQRGGPDDAEAVLLIGDGALRFRAADHRYPFETDLAFEWWLWQHLPFVFSVWVVRKDCDPEFKQRLSRSLQHQLAVNLGQLDVVAQERAATLGVPAEELTRYLETFLYRLGEPEERGITQFAHLLDEHGLR